MKPLTGSQRLGLKYYDDLKERIPRAEVTNIYQYGSSGLFLFLLVFSVQMNFLDAALDAGELFFCV